MSRFPLWAVVAVSSILVLSTHTIAESDAASPDTVETEVTSETAEVVAYATAHGVSTTEALRRSELQDLAGRLDQQLSAERPRGYAGLWIEHSPTFRVVVATAADAQSRVEDAAITAARGTALEGILEMRPVDYSLATLEADQQVIAALAEEFKLTTAIEIMNNRVRVSPTDHAGVEALLAAELPATVDVDFRIHVGRPAASAYAGQPLSNGCTSGFTLVYTTTSPDTYSTSTAGHDGCDSPATLNGVSITYSSRIFAGNFDLRYGNVKSLTPRNWMRISPTTVRTITSRTTKSAQAINAYICKYGRSTDQTCGYLVSKSFTPSYVPNASNGFHQVAPQGGPDMVNGGDSGGPVYRSNSAWGIVSGEYGLPWCICDLIYSPIPFAEGNGVEPEQPLHVYYIP